MPRILYADDDEALRRLIARCLEFEGFECVTVGDQMTGEQALRERVFDCVIADLIMPGNMNLEFIRNVAELRPGVPVIILTGHPTVETAVAAFQLPVTAYLVKPLEMSELMKHLRRALLGSTLLQQVQQMHTNVNYWLTDLAQMAEGLRRSPRTPLETPVAVFMAITYRNVLDSLLGLKTVMEHTLSTNEPSKDVPEAGHSPLLLVNALHETIAVLEKTKDAFRSRDLGDLRKKLEKLLDAEKEQRKEG